MRLLVVSPALPYRGVPHAGGQFLLQHLTALVKEAEIHVVAPATPENVAGLGRVPDELVATLVPLPAGQGRITRWWDARTRGPRPEVTIRTTMLPVVRKAARSADLVELQWSPFAWFGPRLRAEKPWVVYAHDVWTQAEGRRLERARDWFAPGERLALTLLHERRERSQLTAADAVFAFSAKDARLISGLGVQGRVHLLEPWLDLPAPNTVARDPDCVLFTGALFRHENADACRWLLHEVWPRVRLAHPEARLVLAGEGPPADVRQAAEAAPGVTVTGWVDDLNDFYAQAAVFVVPLRLGAGLKFKVPQAMLHALPVVSTTVGAEGLVDEAPEGTFAAVTDDAVDFAAAVLTCLRDPAAAAAVGRGGEQWASRRFAFSHGTQRVNDVYRSLLGIDHRV